MLRRLAMGGPRTFRRMSTEAVSSASALSTPGKGGVPSSKKGMSVAMQCYLEKKRAMDAFIARERSDFELGRKHLANMMGMEEATMTQEDVDKAIAYLFPSGLYHPDARPKMKPPEEIFPEQKEAEFDLVGRPHHPFFYCRKPAFVQSMYEIVDGIENVSLLADRISASGGDGPAEEIRINTPTALSTTRWMSCDEMSDQLRERLTEEQHDELVAALERLLENDYSHKSKELVFRFRVAVAKMRAEEPVTAVDETGSVEFVGQRKTAVARVRVTKPGTGKVRIRHVDHPETENDIRYFYGLKERMTVAYPLQFAKLLGAVDLDCVVGKGGVTSQAGAIRYATAMAIRSFLDEDTVADMKVCGLITQDIRTTERKKPGQKGARAKYIWKKR